MEIPFFVSIPHSGEKVPEFCPWLKAVPEKTLMRDVDRYVDVLYGPALQKLAVPFVKTEWHRYAADLNRIPEDVDQASVVGANFSAGTHSRGFHWVMTTHRETLMPQPMSRDLHNQLVALVYEPFHKSVRANYEKFKSSGAKEVFHLDAHSMPSVGTKEHRDPGQIRADIVVSDCEGKSAKRAYVDLVIASYCRAGFKVAYNWPYIGGRVTEQYGKPSAGQQALQVELSRSLYMDEVTQQLKPEHQKIQKQIEAALSAIRAGLPQIME